MRNILPFCLKNSVSVKTSGTENRLLLGFVRYPRKEEDFNCRAAVPETSPRGEKKWCESQR